MKHERGDGTMSYFLMLFLTILVPIVGICHPSVAANQDASSSLKSNFLSPVFGRNRQAYVDVIRTGCTLDDLYLLILTQFSQYCADVSTQFTMNDFSPILRDENDVVFPSSSGARRFL